MRDQSDGKQEASNLLNKIVGSVFTVQPRGRTLCFGVSLVTSQRSLDIQGGPLTHKGTIPDVASRIQSYSEFMYLDTRSRLGQAAG
jgi:hypothetical protein